MFVISLYSRKKAVGNVTKCIFLWRCCSCRCASLRGGCRKLGVTGNDKLGTFAIMLRGCIHILHSSTLEQCKVSLPLGPSILNSAGILEICDSIKIGCLGAHPLEGEIRMWHSIPCSQNSGE